MWIYLLYSTIPPLFFFFLPLCILLPQASLKRNLLTKSFHPYSSESGSTSHSVESNSLWPHGLYSPWNSPGQNTGVDSHSLLQGIFPTQGSNPDLLHYRQILFQLSHKGSTRILERVAYPFSSRSSQPRNRSGVSCKKSYPNITNTIALNLYITKKVLGPHSNI